MVFMSFLVKTKLFIDKCVRVFKVARKPPMQEVKQVSKVSALGMLVIGLMGFLIATIFILLIL